MGSTVSSGGSGTASDAGRRERLILSPATPRQIVVHEAAAHNLKRLTVAFPAVGLTVITGPSGSGKSSLLFDVIVAELERSTLPLFLSAADRPREGARQLRAVGGAGAARVEGVSFVLAPVRRAGAVSPLETVATRLGIDEHLAVLGAHGGERRCVVCGGPVEHSSVAELAAGAAAFGTNGLLYVLAPIAAADKTASWKRFAERGFIRARVDGVSMRLDSSPEDAGLSAEATFELFVDAISLSSKEKGGRIRGAIELALLEGEGAVLCIHADEGGTELARMTGYGSPTCVACGTPAPTLRPRDLTHRHPAGRCVACRGTGTVRLVSESHLVSDPDRPLNRGGLLPWSRRGLASLRGPFREELLRHGIHLHQRWSEVREELRAALLARLAVIVAAAGGLERKLAGVVEEQRCPECAGTRLGAAAGAILLGGHSLRELAALPLAALEQVLKSPFAFEQQAVRTGAAARLNALASELRSRVGAACSLGLGYLEQSRALFSLSRGERERVGIAEALAMTVSGLVVALDEPTAGLHPDDTAQLIAHLTSVADRGSAVVVVEHDAELIAASGWVIELGPGGGAAGGELIASLPREEFARAATPTAAIVRSARDLPRAADRAFSQWITLEGITRRNLRAIDLSLPLGALTVVAGVSGAGKTTAVTEVLTPLLSSLVLMRERHRKPLSQPDVERECARFGVRRVEGVGEIDRIVDCSELGELGSVRSTVATASGLALVLRELYSRTIEARMRGMDERSFSFNSARGACAVCGGRGSERPGEMERPCPGCGGHRFNEEVLQVRYKGLSIAELYQRSVAELIPLLGAVPRARTILNRLRSLELGYLTLAQSTITLSRGEAQRLRLARAIVRPGNRAMFIFDEPTIGLHGAEVDALVGLLRALTVDGHTVLVVEHHPQLFRAADYLIELGPGAGAAGGSVVAAGSPSQVARTSESRIAKYLRG